MTTMQLINDLRAAGLTVACAESITGGMLCSELVSVPGASAAVAGAVVAYATEAKASVLGVDASALAAEGPVSEAVAAQMAERVAQLFKADFGIATTGVAGPHTVGSHPVGEVYIAVSRAGADTVVQRYELHGERDDVRHSAVSAAVRLLGDELRRGVSESRG